MEQQYWDRQAVRDHIDFAVKPLRLHPLTHRALLDFKKAVLTGAATAANRDELVEDLISDALRLHSRKRDNASKKQVRSINGLAEYLRRLNLVEA